MNINYNRLREIVFILWDNNNDYNSEDTQTNIGSSFKNKHRVYLDSELNLNQTLDLYKDNPEQEFLFFIHLDHKSAKKGFTTFERSSAILGEYIHLKYYIISRYPKAEVYKNNNTLNVYDWDTLYNEVDRTFIPQTVAQMKGEKNNKLKNNTIMKNGIFLSHSSKDKDLVEKFRDLILVNGLGVNNTEIKFTSSSEGGVVSGEDIPDDLKDFLINKTGLFIQFISDDYIKSRTCLNEEGAAWVLFENKMTISILINDLSFDNVSWLKSVNKAFKIDDRINLLNIFNHRKDFFNNIDFALASIKVDEFLKFVNDRK